MKESCRKGLTSHPDPESCAVGRKVAREALTGAHAGRVLSCEIKRVQRADDVALTEGYLPRGVLVSRSGTLRSQRPRACMETPRARTGRPQGCPPRSMVGRLAKAKAVRPTCTSWGVGRVRSTDEGSEQRRRHGVDGGPGGKAPDQGEHEACPPSRRTQRRTVVSRVGCSVCVRPHRSPAVFAAASIRGRSRMR